MHLNQFFLPPAMYLDVRVVYIGNTERVSCITCSPLHCVLHIMVNQMLLKVSERLRDC